MIHTASDVLVCMGGIDNILVTILNIPNALYTANIDNKGR